MNLVGKRQLVSELARESKIDRDQADFIYDVLMDIMSHRLRAGKEVDLIGVGKILLVKAKGFRSNLTGVSIPNHKRMTFLPNRKLARTIRVVTRVHPIKS